MNVRTHSQADVSAPAPERPEAQVWLTKAGQDVLFQKQAAALPFETAFDDGTAIHIDPAQRFQTMEGFGFALTGGSAYLIRRLPLAERQALLRELFLPDGEGIGVSYLRLTVGASDLSERSFSYNDLPPGEVDTELARFDLRAGDQDVIPLLKDILSVNPAIKLLASPWSAPPWMKTNRHWIGGKLRPEYYPVYAKYWVKYLQIMHAQGIPIQAITVQNEPLNPQNEPSMLMEADEQALFIADYLWPALRDAGLDKVEVFCWDHNCDRKDYPLTVLADPRARPFIAGVAWHLYAGDISALSDVHQAYPDKKTYFTEQWVGRRGEFANDLNWHVKYVLVGATRHWAQVVLEWNLASDPDCDPHTPGGGPDCKGALTLGQGIERNVAYYVIAHAAKFVRPGAVRLFSNAVDGLPNVAFASADGHRIVLIVLNDSADRRAFPIQYKGRRASAILEGGAVGTYLWPS